MGSTPPANIAHTAPRADTPPPPLFALLESFSHITRGVRDGAVQVLSHPYVKPLVPLVPRNVVSTVIGGHDTAPPVGAGGEPARAFGLIGRGLNPDSERRLRDISRSVEVVSNEYETAGQYATFLAREIFTGRYGREGFEMDVLQGGRSGRASPNPQTAPRPAGSNEDMMLPEHLADVDLNALVDREAFVVVPPGPASGQTQTQTQTSNSPSFAVAPPYVNPTADSLLISSTSTSDSTHTLSMVPPTFSRSVLSSPAPPHYSSRHLSRSRLGPVSPEEFLTPGLFLDADGRMALSQAEFRRVAFERGFENDLRCKAWEYLVGVVKWEWTEGEVVRAMEEKRTRYLDLKQRWIDLLDAYPPENPDPDAPPPPSSFAAGADNNTGEAHREQEQNQAPGDERIHATGSYAPEDVHVVVDRLRERKWRIEKDTVRTDRTIPLFSSDAPNMVAQFTPPVARPTRPSGPGFGPPSEMASSTSTTPATEPTSDATLALSGAAADWSPSLWVLRDVLMTYCAWNGESMGYVQGMNEWASVCVGISGEGGEVAAYELLSAVLSLRLSTFSRTSTTISSDLELLSSLLRVHDPKLYVHLRENDGLNMFCCFRWLLVWYKREVEWAGVGGLWEVFLSAHLHIKYYLFFALTLLTTDPFRTRLMEAEGFDGILKTCNEVGEFIHNYKGGIEALLAETELVFYRFNWKLARLVNLHIPDHQNHTAVSKPLIPTPEPPIATNASGSSSTPNPPERKPVALPYAHRWLLDLKTEVDSGLGWAFGKEWTVGEGGWVCSST